MKLFARLGTIVALVLIVGGCASVRAPGPVSPPPAPGRAPGWPGSAWLFLPGRASRELVRFEVIDGVAVRGGDVVLGPVNELAWRYALPRPRQSAHTALVTPDTSYLWPGGVMPFEIDASVRAEKRTQIAQAIEELNETALELRPRTAADRDYVVFSEGSRGLSCNSHIGRLGGGQEIHVRDCSKGGVIHEVMHAAGFDHEQCRADRDDHVTIHWDEIEPGFEGAFEKSEGMQDSGPYDYESIMHYHATAFSRSGRPTITAKDPNVELRYWEVMSSGDRAAIAQLYGNAPPVPPGELPTLPGLPGLCLPGGITIPVIFLPTWPKAL